MRNFVVYKSSAGSGKTFTLVKEYLRLALLDEKKLSSSYRRILAITFTNKAAAEMKSRVVTALDQIANQKSPPFVAQLLCEELAVPMEELRRRASYVLSHILHHYSDFSIGTIDSFTHKIVKTFAHDLKLPVNFNVELDTAGFYEKVIASLFNRIGEDDYIGKLLKEYVLTKAQDNASWDPESHMQEFSKLLLKENSGEYVEQLQRFSSEELEQFRRQFLDFIKHYKETLQAEARKAIDLIQENGLSDADFHYKASGPQSFFRKCLDNSITFEQVEKGRVVDAVLKNKWANDSGPNKASVEKISPQLTSIASTLLEFARENYRYYSLCELLSRQMYPLMLLKKIEEISQQQKQEERLVFISEFNNKIYEIINHEPTPFIYERLGERYQHYLLDEFQDTSSLQWHNILPLLDNSLSNGWFNLIVGDGKQSIYRWRNANVRQFASLPLIENKAENPIISERGQSLERNFSGQVLSTNYRSLKTIVEFNNEVFGFLSDKLLSADSQSIYEGQKQEIKNTNEGYVTVTTGKQERDELDAYTCSLVQKHIAHALKDGFEHKDICILARKNAHGNTIAKFLVAQKIPVVSSDSLLLRNNLEINTILCYLRYLVNREDTISAAAIVNYLYQCGRINEAEFHQSLAGLSTTRSLSEILEPLGILLPEAELSLNNLFDHCTAIIKSLDLTRTGYHYIRFFLDEVNEFLVLKNSTIGNFLDWWESRSARASMIIPENTNAVRIMTIHASKGLEFPMVIIPYCNWPVYQAGDSWVQVNNEKVELPVTVIHLTKKVSDSGFEQELLLEEQEQTLDNLNLLYVAFTRAVERLHIISTKSASNRLVSVSDWIDELMHAIHKASGENFFEIGQASRKQSRHSAVTIPDLPLEPLAFNTGENTIQIKASYLNNTELVEEAKQQGIVMHWLLSRIRTLQDQEAALEAALIEGLISRDELPELSKKLSELIRHPQLSEFFQPGANSKLEAELITAAGEILRPDRILFSGDTTVLIDYKTGKENNDKYFKQLYKYESALLSMGYAQVKKLLVYVDDLKVVAVN